MLVELLELVKCLTPPNKVFKSKIISGFLNTSHNAKLLTRNGCSARKVILKVRAFSFPLSKPEIFMTNTELST